jgi:hypothetical protein
MNKPETQFIKPQGIKSPYEDKQAPEMTKTEDSGKLESSGSPVILKKSDFEIQVTDTIKEVYPDDTWNKFADETLNNLNTDQRLQTKGGIYLSAFPDMGRKVGVASVKWVKDGEEKYSMMIGMQKEIEVFVQNMMAMYGKPRPSARERHDLRRAKARAAKRKLNKG